MQSPFLFLSVDEELMYRKYADKKGHFYWLGDSGENFALVISTNDFREPAR